MTESILAALISGGVTLLGVLLSNSRRQAVTDTKMEELTREVRAHNDFARRMPVVGLEPHYKNDKPTENTWMDI